jgi:DnaJ domain
MDPYTVLGLPREASLEDVKRAYRRRSRELHPDTNPAPGAHRAMAEVNAAYEFLTDSLTRDRPVAPRRHARETPPAAAQRAEKMKFTYGGDSEAPQASPRPAARPPAEGRGAPQPERLPDWYEFLDLHMNATSAEVIAALEKVGREVRTAGYSAEDETLLLVQLRKAAETLTNPRLRKVYDAALCGTPPAPGTFPLLHRDWYSFLGVRRSSPLDRIADQVTALSGSTRKGSGEYREVELAWKTLREPASRAAYDASL